MSSIISENLTWDINWVNTSFTFSSTPNTILNIFVDWVEVFASDYSITTNTILFTWVIPLFSVRAVYIVWSGQALNNSEILITNEVPVWTINWTNVTFTCNNTIDKVLSIVKDWVETTDFTISGNIITFSVAPIYNVLTDYITSSVWADSSDFSWNSNQSDIINRIYNDIIKVNINSTVFKLDTTKEFINEIQRSLLQGDYVALNWLRYKWSVFNFLHKTQFIDFKDWTRYVWEDSEIWDNINIWSNNFTSWYIYAWWDVIKYTSNSWWILSWLTWRWKKLKKGTEVYEIFKLDLQNYKNVNVMFWEYELLCRDWQNKYLKSWYEIINDYYNNKYIWLIWISNAEIVVKYQREIPDITSTVNSIMPKDYWIKILPYLVAARHLMLWDEINKAQLVEWIWLTAFKELQLNYARDKVDLNSTMENLHIPYYY